MCKFPNESNMETQDRYEIKLDDPDNWQRAYVWDTVRKEIIYSATYKELSLDAQSKARGRCQAFLSSLLEYSDDLANSDDHMYMDMASRAARKSKATKRKVGAIAVKDQNVIGMGINGTPTGWYTNEDIDPDTGATCQDSVLHAEENLVAKMARNGISIFGATVYCTTAPCPKCARLLAQAGVARVVYDSAYRDETGLVMLGMLGVEVEKLEG